MVEIRIINDWIKKAEEDLQFGLINLQEHKPFFAQICFHFHQAIEKILKAYIIANELEFKKIHDLVLLLLLEAIKYLHLFPSASPLPMLGERVRVRGREKPKKHINQQKKFFLLLRIRSICQITYPENSPVSIHSFFKTDQKSSANPRRMYS